MDVSVRPMTLEDFPLAMRLKERAGWNQTEADWLRAVYLQPEGCFVAQWDGRLVGTTTTCILGSVAWVAMVLVDETVRRRGIGTTLMRHALAFLDATGVKSVRLDATPMGQPLYAQLGFEEQYRLSRYVGTLPSSSIARMSSAGGGGRQVELLAPDHLESLLACDRAVTATDRHKLLIRLFAERPDLARVVRDGSAVSAFLISRPRLRGVQVGPCIADHEGGVLLLGDACRRYAGQEIFIDIPPDNPHAAAFAQSLGLTVQRQLVRMCRGQPVTERQELMWASFGPEKG
jgi:GNAT superfamily N-acetyltransferase